MSARTATGTNEAAGGGIGTGWHRRSTGMRHAPTQAYRGRRHGDADDRASTPRWTQVNSDALDLRRGAEPLRVRDLEPAGGPPRASRPRAAGSWMLTSRPETAALTRAQVLQQAGNAMLAQANQLPQNVLTLLRG